MDLMVSEGIEFQTGVTIGKDISAGQLLDDFDAIVLCLGSTWPRDLTIPGHFIHALAAIANPLQPDWLGLRWGTFTCVRCDLL